MSYKVGDRVNLPFGETGTIKEIVSEKMDWFPIKVRIRKSNGFNKTNEVREFRESQISIERNFMKEVEAVRALGDAIGYGNLMCIASALWREKLRPNNTEIGAFVPALISDINADAIDMYKREIKAYDGLVKKRLR